MDEFVQLDDLPEELLEAAYRRVLDYSVGLIDLGAEGDQGHLRGSGTLVEIHGLRGILTAAHVLEGLESPSRLGLILPRSLEDPTLHRATVRFERDYTVRVGQPPFGPDGPDLGFLILPDPDVGAFAARKSFCNLSKHAERTIKNPLLLAAGLWFLWGLPNIRTTEMQPERGYERVVGFRGGYFTSQPVERFAEAETFDFLEVAVPRIAFGGVSGGGLWQIPLGRAGTGELVALAPILSGVAFFQSFDADATHSVVTCHGRRSVYAELVSTFTHELTAN